MEEKLNLTWHKFMEGSLPPANVDVIAYSKKWIHPDYNQEGIRIGFIEEDRFYSAQWDGDSNYSTHCSDDNDYYEHNGKDELPEYWIEIPKLTLFKVLKDHKEFELFQKVLVAADCDDSIAKKTWSADLYGHYDSEKKIHYCVGYSELTDDEIISYEDNEDKLGTLIETK